jgi:5-methylcytosine-specific restriction endonuclease McrA
MAVTKVTPSSSSPQPLDVQDILREVDQVEHDCAVFLFPHRRIRCRSKSAAERRHIAEVRAQLYERSAGQCELRSSPKCLVGITFETMHACHVISRARGGRFDLENLKAGCPECHIGWEHNGGKPCPPKTGGEL